MKEKGKEAILSDFGKRLAKYREARNMTQMDVAVVIESYPGYISRMENGKVEPGLFMILALAEALDITPNELIGSRSIK
ncbi:helix-turn-helix domain-containing protein [Chitinophaga caseinilytica]|uniref:helix-turn-helix domain-containing protein n=1 Tax=Chitinophaga caseinilytica TaxID=2267521 RepID=UPI003C2BB1E9